MQSPVKSAGHITVRMMAGGGAVLGRNLCAANPLYVANLRIIQKREQRRTNERR